VGQGLAVFLESRVFLAFVSFLDFFELCSGLLQDVEVLTMVCLSLVCNRATAGFDINM
jgi:hypothetical protein